MFKTGNVSFPAARLRWLALAAAVLIAACTTSPIAPENKAAIRNANIGVVSLLGNQFNGIYVGVTVFGNESYVAAVPDWKIDTFVSDTLLSDLHRRGYRASRLALGTAPVEGFSRPVTGLMQSGTDVDFKRLLALAAEQRFTTLALVAKARANANDPHEHFMQGSYGLYERNVMGLHRSCLYSFAGISFIDVATGRFIGSSKATPCDSWDDDLPDWKSSFAQLSPAEQQTLRNALFARIGKQLLKAVRDIEL